MMSMPRIFVESLRVIAPIVIIGAGVGVFFVFGRKPEAASRGDDAQTAPLVKVAEVSGFDGSFNITVEGGAVPFRQITYSAQVEGRIVEKSPDADAGHYVSQGDFLMLIDEEDYQLEVERLEAQVREAENRLEELAVDLQNTAELVELGQEDLALQQKDLARFEELIDRGATTETQLISAQRQELASRNALVTLQNQERSLEKQRGGLEAARDLARVQLRQAQLDLKRARVTAPVSGTIVEDHVEQDDFVRVGDPLVRINDTTRMEVRCNLRVEELYWIWLQSGGFGDPEEVPQDALFEIPPAPVEIVYEFSGARFVWQGTLSRYDGTGLDPQTRTVPCRVLVEEPTQVRVEGDEAGRVGVQPPTLFSGMYVTVRIPITPPFDLLQIPHAAVQPQNTVWVVRDGALKVLPIDVAWLTGDAALIRKSPDAPQSGDQVVVSPLAAPVDGMPVEVEAAE